MDLGLIAEITQTMGRNHSNEMERFVKDEPRKSSLQAQESTAKLGRTYA
jgi:hypothetical protein